MKATFEKFGVKKFITDSNGDVESVVLPLVEYQKMIELIEDYGLGLAMQESEEDKTYTKDEALRYLDEH